MKKHLEENEEFSKVDLCRKLFNQCSISELTVIEQLHNKGVFRRMAIKKSEDRTEEIFERMNCNFSKEPLN